MSVKIQKHGVRKAEMEASMLPLKKTNSVSIPTEKLTTIAFTIFGQHDELTDEYGNSNSEGYPLLYDVQDNSGKITPADQLPNAFAKVVKGKKIRYFIKTNSMGKFFNPMGLFTEDRHNKTLRHAGKAEWEFIFYVSFLKTRNKARLINAERENF